MACMLDSLLCLAQTPIRAFNWAIMIPYELMCPKAPCDGGRNSLMNLFGVAEVIWPECSADSSKWCDWIYSLMGILMVIGVILVIVAGIRIANRVRNNLVAEPALYKALCFEFLALAMIPVPPACVAFGAAALAEVNKLP